MNCAGLNQCAGMNMRRNEHVPEWTCATLNILRNELRRIELRRIELRRIEYAPEWTNAPEWTAPEWTRAGGSGVSAAPVRHASSVFFMKKNT